jgi:hypothetical protein
MKLNKKTLGALATAIAALVIALSGVLCTSCRYTSTLEPIQGSLQVTTQPR